MRAFHFHDKDIFVLITTMQRLALVSALCLALGLVACASGKDEQLAYDVCLAGAKKDPKYTNATFATKEKSNVQDSTGDAGIRVNIPYELDGKKGLYQCIADKKTDGNYQVTY